jgi:hypothetical protein
VHFTCFVVWNLSGITQSATGMSWMSWMMTPLSDSLILQSITSECVPTRFDDILSRFPQVLSPNELL